TCRWVRPDQTLFKRCREQRPHWGEHLPHASRRQPAPGKLGGKLLHVPRLDRRKLHPAEETDGIPLEERLVVGGSMRPAATRSPSGVALDPFRSVLAERHL